MLIELLGYLLLGIAIGMFLGIVIRKLNNGISKRFK